MNWIYEPWPWYIAGPMIAFIMLLLIMVDKSFGMSSNLRTVCTICGGGKYSDFFKFDWKSQKWNLIVATGTVIGGYIGAHFLSKNLVVGITADTIADLNTLGFKSAGNAYLPTELFNAEIIKGTLTNNYFIELRNILLLATGGLLVGFGARYAGGCTSGHAISGLSNLQLPSLIAVIGFFMGGLLMVHLIFPMIF
ncbi:YeeE/YedE family protein [Flavobacteriaceae bacterium]|nr:YeeE/YedE family protein [Flavobacteriaceae bacterium]MDC0098105.1 YeeE/YedE family protein [Flavobacteriaceae bacterium]